MKTLLSALLFVTIILTGCAGTHDSHKTAEYASPARKRIALSNTNKIKRTLYSQFKSWKSVRYKSGGLSKRGVDCSGFVYLTFINRFGIELPRTTALQARAGSRVAKNKLKAGDLVFFKTGVKVRHVGIYIEDSKFIHASTSKGVTISSLNNNYWSKKYWKSIRVKT
jgi:cell wall-associated NlpC family hydrolase